MKVKHWKLPTDRDVTVLWSSAHHYYLKFSSVHSMSHWYAALQRPQYNEVIRRDVRRKFFLDLDDEPDIERVLGSLKGMFGDDIAVFCTSPQRYHLVMFRHYSTCHRTCRWLAEYVARRYQIASIDMSCYASVKCLRLEGSYKGANRKTSMSGHSFLEGLVTCVDDDAEELALQPPPRAPVAVAPQGVSVQWSLDDFEVRTQQNGMVLLDRLRPSYCAQCQRIHDNENAAVIHGQFVCWRYANRNRT